MPDVPARGAVRFFREITDNDNENRIRSKNKNDN